MTSAPGAAAALGTTVTASGLVAAYARRSWRQVAAILLLALFSSAIAMVGPALVAATLAALQVGGSALPESAGTTFDLNSLGQRVLRFWPFKGIEEPAALVVLLGLGYLLQATVGAAVQYTATVLAVRIRARTLRLIQNDVMSHLLRQSLRFFNRSRVGELMSRLIYDADHASSGVGPAVLGLLQHGLQIVGYGLYLFSTSGVLTVGASAIVCLHFGLNRLLKEPVKRFGSQVRNRQAQLSSALNEIFTSVRVIKSFGAERLALERTSVETEQFRQALQSQGQIDSINDPARAVLDALALVAVVAIAAVEVRRGRLAPQGLLLYVFVARVVIQPANLLATSYLRLAATTAALSRIADIFNQAPAVVDGVLDPPRFEQTIELQDVSFAHEVEPVLKHVSLTIARGDVVAIVGRSGAGKSTLTDLVLRLYDPTDGRVLMDGIDLRTVRQMDYRHLFGVVSQESLLLNDTIRNNIRFGREELGDERLVESARSAHAHHFIERLPQGYDTFVGDRGVRLSGGERQRIAIARAIAHQPQILILDEATSSLDSESEREVQLALEDILERATAIVIAHRLSTILHADKIVFLDEGAIVDSGRHLELFERCLPYRRLCELQFLGGVAADAGPSA